LLDTNTETNELYGNCLKYELFIKLAITSFSLLSCWAAVTLMLCILINVDYFIEKLLDTYLYIIYQLLGPYLLGLVVFSFINYEKVVYVCEKDGNKNYSYSNVVFLILAFCFSVSITVFFKLNKVFNLILNSILRKQGGNSIIRTCFLNLIIKNN